MLFSLKGQYEIFSKEHHNLTGPDYRQDCPLPFGLGYRRTEDLSVGSNCHTIFKEGDKVNADVLF
jgi:hypothetical protein